MLTRSAVAAFLVGIALTSWTCMRVLDVQQAQVRSDFQRDADKVASDTNVRLRTYFDMLLSIKAAVTVNDRVDRAQFARYVRELQLAKRYPGFQAIQFVRPVPATDLARFSAAVRADRSVDTAGYPGFAVHPSVPLDEHFIIEFTEPMKGNENAFGLDLAALPLHRAVIETARDSGQIVATGRISLVQDSARHPAFVARAPVYRQGMPVGTVEERRSALIGLVAIVFRLDVLMQEVIDPARMKEMTFQLHDAGPANGASAAPDAANMLFDTTRPAGGMLGGLETEARIDVAQRQWVMRFGALADSSYARDVTSVVLIGGGGVVFSILIAALMIASGRSRALAGRLRGTLEAQRAFQDSASVGIALFEHGVIVRCNRGMEEIMGYAPDQLSGQPIEILSPPGSAAFAVEPYTLRWQSELELVRKDGSTIWCLINGKALDTADLAAGGVWVIQDISVRKNTEAALVDAKDGLQHSLEELEAQKANVETAHSDLSSVLATLKQAQTNLITSEKMASLGSLVAGIAHELNTPIGNSLLTATALADMVGEFEKKYVAGGIKRSALEALMTDTKLACSIMAGSLRRAADLITSFKQVAVDQTSDHRRGFDLCDVVHDLLATYAAQLRRANCEAQVDLPAALLLDSYPGSVGQVLSNLLNNALLHAFDGRASARVTIAARATDDEQVLLVFGDDGGGMPAKVLHQVFDPFFTTKMGQGGSGLGMNIVYNIVTGMLGGRIAIESVLGKGTTVTIHIPRVAPKRDTDDADLDVLVI